MKIFAFDLLPYPERLDHLTIGQELLYPLPKQHCKPSVAARTYSEHLEAWALMDDIGFDGIGFNEHHTSPYGLMNSPNVMAAAASQRTSRMKLLIYGNLLPIHDPLRLAEELAMLDCISEGRLISGFARGIPREHQVYQVPMKDSPARFREAWQIIKLAWTEEVFSYQGEFWSYKDVAIWPRPLQQPHPPVWVPVTGSQETIEWAGRENIPITPGLNNASIGFRQDIIRYYAECLEKNGHHITPNHLSASIPAFVADSRAQAVNEAGPYMLYFWRTLFSHGNIYNPVQQQKEGFLKQGAYDYVRPENRQRVLNPHNFRNMTLEGIARNDALALGSPEEVRDHLIMLADTLGINTLLLNFNQGGLPHEMFMNQLRRFGDEVLPALQAHEVNTVPLA